MHFHVTANNLNYPKATSFYLPLLTPVIHGNATTNVDFNLDSNGLKQLNLHSNLSGIKLDAPEPLQKTESVATSFNLQLIPNPLGFNNREFFISFSFRFTT
jgi:uncharacterized protein YhdP